MGVGTNIQARAVALHHLDCPWRPADLAQREGRILRQGNQNEEIGIYRYVAEGSFDTYLWQTVERKARFIHQLLKGSLDVREIEDIGDATLSAAEAKALASGNPLLLDKATTDTELTTLERRRRAYDRNQHALDRTIEGLESSIVAIDEELPLLRASESRRRETRGKAFEMTIGGQQVRERTEAAGLLREWSLNFQAVPRRGARTAEVSELGGLTITATYNWELGADWITFYLRDADLLLAEVSGEGLSEIGIGNIRQLENRLTELPERIASQESEREEALAEIDNARTAKQRPFRHAELLEATRKRAKEIDAELAQQAAESAKSAAARARGENGDKSPSAPSEDALAVHREVLDENRYAWIDDRANELVRREGALLASSPREPDAESPFATLYRGGAQEHWLEREGERAARWVAVQRAYAAQASLEPPGTATSTPEAAVDHEGVGM